MNSKKIAFITCVNNDEVYEECLRYIFNLDIPKEYEIDTIAIREAKSMAAAYNAAIKSTDAKFKVYLHQDTFIVNRRFIFDIINLFKSNMDIGMIGVIGASTISSDCTWLNSKEKYGQVYKKQKGIMDLLAFNQVSENYKSVKMIDGLIMITQYDIPWREDIFNGWNFYDISQSIEFILSGYKVVIPYQNNVWCIHDSEMKSLDCGDEHYKNVYINEYSKRIMNLYLNEIINCSKEEEENIINWRNEYLDIDEYQSIINKLDKYINSKYKLSNRKDNILFQFDRIKALSVLKSNKEEFSSYLNKTVLELSKKNYEMIANMCYYIAKFASFNHPGKFRSSKLEELLIECGNNLPNKVINTSTYNSKKDKRRILHVLSEGYSVGGHTKLIKNWIKNDAESIHSIVATWQLNTTLSSLLEEVKENGGWIESLEGIQGMLEKASVLRDLSSEWADLVILHIHTFDTIPIMAFAKKGGPPVLLMNHADHLFWLGGSIVDGVIDYRYSGKELTLKRRNINRNYILPIPLDTPCEKMSSRDEMREAAGIDKEMVVLLTIASQQKFETIGKIHYLDIMRKVIEDNPNTIVIIVGPEENGEWEKAKKDTNGRIIPLGVQAEIDIFYEIADIYIDSYMLGSNTSALEAGLRKLPVASLINNYNKTLSFNDISYSESTDDLHEFLSNVNKLIRDNSYREKCGNKLCELILNDHIYCWRKYLEEIYINLIGKEHKIYNTTNRKEEEEEEEVRDEDLFLALYYNTNYEKLNKLIKKYKTESVKNYCIKKNQNYEVIEPRQMREVYRPTFYEKNQDKIVKVESPEIYIAELHDVSVVGENSVIIAGEECLYDIAKRDNGERYDLAFDSVVKYEENHISIKSFESNEVIDEGVFIVGFAPYNYYHFTIELLSRLKYVDSFEKYSGIPIIIDEVISKIPQYYDLLKCVNKKNRPIIFIKKNYKYKVNKLIYPSYNTWMPIKVKKGIELDFEDSLISKSSVTNIRNSVLDYDGRKGTRKIFISRKNTSNSRIINENEVIELFVKYGFEVIYPEELTFKQQIDIFSEAEYVVGASGAAFTNIIYCPNNAKIVCIIPEKYNFYIYSSIANLLDIKSIFLDASVVEQKNNISTEKFICDLDYCENFLKDMKRKKKLKVVFFTQAESVWASTESVWKAFSDDERCITEVVQLPFYHNNYEDNVGKYLEDKKIDFKYWYNFNIEEEKPDVVFFQNSYDQTRPSEYSVESISRTKAKIIYIPYALEIIKKWAGSDKDYIEVISESDLMQKCWRMFLRSRRSKKMYENYSKRGSSHMVVSGHPKIDFVVNSNLSKSILLEKFKIEKGVKVFLWNPNISEFGGDERWKVHFDILKVIKEFKNIKVIFRPHPLQLKRLKSPIKDEDMQFEKFREDLFKCNNIIIDDSKDYRESFELSDALITCSSSLIFEYLVTDKAILYTPAAYDIELNEDRKILDYLYKGIDEASIYKFINMILDDNDSMKVERINIKSEFLYGLDGKNGERIKEYVINELYN